MRFNILFYICINLLKQILLGLFTQKNQADIQLSAKIQGQVSLI